MKDAREAAAELSIGLRALLYIGIRLIRILARTWRFRVVGGEHLARLRGNQRAFMVTLWHGELLPLLWHHRGQGVTVLVSEHKDGEIVARVLDMMGYGLIRGSTSRGAGRALIGIVKLLREGREVAVTPDGPRGPRHTVAPGAVIAAYRAAAPVLPVTAHVSRSWRLRSWDEFVIPAPFARVTIAYGEPVTVDASSARDAAQSTSLIETAMRDTARIACA